MNSETQNINVQTFHFINDTRGHPDTNQSISFTSPDSRKAIRQSRRFWCWVFLCLLCFIGGLFFSFNLL